MEPDATRPPPALRTSRRRVLRTTGAVAGALALGVGTASADASNNPAMPGRIYADDRLFATRGLTVLPSPNGHNDHSFDALFAVTDGVDGQHAVGEAAPGEPDFNGGRWETYTATWVGGTPTLLTSDDAVRAHEAAGHLTVTEGSPGGAGAPPDYFECPLVPLKD